MKGFSVSPLRMELHQHAYALPCERTGVYGTDHKFSLPSCCLNLPGKSTSKFRP